MNLRDEEQLQQYFERKMSASQEQNFLIDVAARDDMRLAFRSQLEMLKALRADKDAAVLPAALLRARTLSSLGIGTMMMVPATDGEHEVAHAAVTPGTNVLRHASFLLRPAAMLVMGLLLGAGITYSVLPGASTMVAEHQATVTQAAPSPIIITEPAEPATAADAPASAPQLQNAVHTTTTHRASHSVSAATQPAGPNTVPLVKNTKPATISVQTKVHREDHSSK